MGGARAATATRESRPAPTRTCVACRTARPKRELLRVVRTPDGRVLVDETGRVAGRGAYVCRDGDCVANAIDKGLLGKALEARLSDELRSSLGQDVLTNTPMTTEDHKTNDEGGARGEE